MQFFVSGGIRPCGAVGDYSKRKPEGCAPPDPAGTFARAKVPKSRQPLGLDLYPGALYALRGVFSYAANWKIVHSARFSGPMVGEASAQVVLAEESS